MRLDRIGRAHLAELSARERIGRQFRLDVRAASHFPVRESARTPADHLTLVRPDGRVIEYQRAGAWLLRVERRGETVLRRESYAFPSRTSVRFQVYEEPAATFVSLVLPRKPEPGISGPDRDIRIEAQLGKDERLTGVEERE
jgi:hypothetical protein